MKDMDLRQETLIESILAFWENFTKRILRKMYGSDTDATLNVFFDDDKNLYEADGKTLTKEYRKKMDEMREFLKKTPVADEVCKCYEDSESKDVIGGISEYVEDRRAKMKDYDNEYVKRQSNVGIRDIDEFAIQFAEGKISQDKTHEAARQMLENMNEVMEDEIIDNLENEHVRDSVNEMLRDEKDEHDSDK